MQFPKLFICFKKKRRIINEKDVPGELQGPESLKKKHVKYTVFCLQRQLNRMLHVFNSQKPLAISLAKSHFVWHLLKMLVFR